MVSDKCCFLGLTVNARGAHKQINRQRKLTKQQYAFLCGALGFLNESKNKVLGHSDPALRTTLLRGRSVQICKSIACENSYDFMV